ncbi:Protein mlp1 [Coniothyrium glycines]
MAAAVVDVAYLAASYAVPDTTFHSLLSEPTVELVQALLVQIEAKARQYDDLQSEKVKIDVQLEDEVQTGAQRARALKAAAEKAQKEADALRQKLEREEIRREQVESELRDIRASATTSTSEVQALESRIKTLESQNRDALAMHEAKVAAHDRLAKELSEQHQKSVDLRKQVSALEDKNQALESAASNVKFRETNLQQEIEALRKNNDWYTTELKTRSDDHSKYRKEKNAQVAQLQRENADASETIDSLRRTETLLRQHIDELKGKAEEDRLRIEELENKASKDEADFRIELDNVRRLAKLHQNGADSAKKRLEELQAELENIKESAAEEVGLLQADIELERTKAMEAEAHAAELEILVESLKSEANEMRQSVRIPATPRRGLNGSLGTPSRAGSPAVFSPGGSHIKADATRTQLLIENNDLKKDLRRQREKNEEQMSMIQEMVDELEQRVPELEEVRRENEALNAQIANLSSLLDDATREREAAGREQRKATGELEALRNELKTYEHQVQDMTIQLRSLLWRREAEENGLDSLPAEQKQFVLDSVNNLVPEEHLTSDSDSHNHITRLLLLYTNVKDLQAKNIEQLKTLRSLADSHEVQLARSRAAQHDKDQEELSSLRSLIAEKDDQIKSLNTRSQTFKAERDMYMRIVSSRGQQLSASQGPSSFAQSVPAGAHPLQLEGLVQQEVPEYKKLIKDLQSHIDLLKEESATDRATSKSQVDGLTKENNELQTDKIRLESQVRREQDRYSRLEGTIKLLQSEKETLQERYNSIQTTLAKQDDRIVKADQDVAEAATRIQGLESEIVHLKASQQVAKTIEERLKERNQELMEERDRLSKHVSEIQSLRNEQELATANSRRELQSRVDKLEADLQNTQQKLESEVADHKKTTQQRDYERSEAQRRIDDLITARNNAEVKSASADSVRQQLEQRIKDLQTQVQTADDRLQSLQPRPAPRVDGAMSEDAETASPDDELAAQVADLQRKLERKQEDLDTVNVQLEQFQNIAQDAEERLQSFVEAHERLQEELNLAQQDKDATISDLQQRVEDISSELAKSTTELNEIRGRHEQETLQLSQEKDVLETEITKLRNEVSDYKEEAAAQSELVKTQADIAARAQQDYEHELDKHGETMKTLRTLREEHNQLKTEIAEYNAQAESARTKLEQSEEHWHLTESRYEEQINEAKRRHDDLKQYNETLLKQFDDYKAQIDGLKHDRVPIAVGDAGSAANSNNLQDIETYLRREKEILEVQLNLKEQEAKRLEQQLTHAQTQLDQTREKLIAEQSKSQGTQSGASLQTLQDRVQELNVYRESNMTLRNENSRLQTQLAERTKDLDDLRSELEPLQVHLTELEGEIELNVGHLKAVEEDRDRWQKRHQDVLQRYDRIDPKELEDLKKQIDDLSTERDQALEQVNSLNEKIRTVEAAQESLVAQTREATVQEVRAAEQDKARKGFNKVHNEKMSAKKVEIDGLIAERDAAQSQLAAVQQELQQSQAQLVTVQSEAHAAREQVNALQQQLQQAQSDLAARQQQVSAVKTGNDTNASTVPADVDMAEEGQIEDSSPVNPNEQVQKLKQDLAEAQKRALDAQNTANAADSSAASLAVQFSFAKDQVTNLDKEVAEKGNRILELQTELAAVKSQPAQQEQTTAPITSTDTAANEEVQRLKEEVAAAQKEIETLRAQLAEAKAHSEPKDNVQAIAPQAAEQSASLQATLDQREADLRKLEASLQERETKVARREAKTESIMTKANEKITTLKANYEKEINGLKAGHETELARLKQEKQTNGGPAAEVADASQANQASATAPESENMFNTEDLPRPVATKTEIRSWMISNPGAKQLLHELINNNVTKQVAKERQIKKDEIERLREEFKQQQGQAPAAGATSVKQESDQPPSQQTLQDELNKVKAEHEQALKAAVTKKESDMKKQEEMKMKIKTSQINAWQAKWAVVEKAAKETPQEEVVKVYIVAKSANVKPQAQPTTPARPAQAPQSASTQAPAATAALKNPQQQQPAAVGLDNAQQNGPTVAPGPQAALAQQSNPFLPAGHGNAPSNTTQASGQAGRGLPQLGFISQAQPQSGLPQQPPPQQQQQMLAGRVSGIAAIRGAIQSNIPRGGGSGIPMPGGRGRGQANQNQPQGQHANGPAAGASQIGRGGGRGGGRGRGQGSASNQNSPARGGINPTAQSFSPAGAGRGQKRGAEDEGEGGTRGGKRPRGRGGQGGGGATGGAPPAAE